VQDQEKEEEAQGGPEHVEGVLDVGRELLLRVTGAGEIKGVVGSDVISVFWCVPV
jgi:hypothetical protein